MFTHLHNGLYRCRVQDVLTCDSEHFTHLYLSDMDFIHKRFFKKKRERERERERNVKML